MSDTEVLKYLSDNQVNMYIITCKDVLLHTLSVYVNDNVLLYYDHGFRQQTDNKQGDIIFNKVDTNYKGVIWQNGVDDDTDCAGTTDLYCSCLID